MIVEGQYCKDVMIGGFAKCGTSALSVNLRRDNRIKVSDEISNDNNSTNLFNTPEDQQYTHVCKDTAFVQNLSTYLKQAPNQDLSWLKLIICIRHPIQRLESYYHFLLRRGIVNTSFMQFLNGSHAESVEQSRYTPYIKQCIKHIPTDNVVVITQERMLHDTPTVMKKVYKLLNMSTITTDYTDTTFFRQFTNPHSRHTLTQNYNAQYEYPNSSSAEYKQTIEFLKEKIAPWMEETRTFLQDDLPEWTHIDKVKYDKY